ncbi:MAG: hypothetical protein EOP07_08930 [Proteobacteria bacterium]|nr:MAG: hypothetical protein EOP07_08930 [Pseudomonadota bacterium]
MTLFKNILLLSVLFPIASSCKTVGSQSSMTKHDAGRFLNSNDFVMWGDFSEAEYQTLQAKIYSSKMLPIDHELTKRLQFWADTIRLKMIEVMPEVASVPAPKVRILKSDTVNAFAQAVKVSLAADIATVSTTAAQVPDAQPVTLGNPCSTACLEFKGNLEAKRRLLEEGQKRINPGCKVEVANDSLKLGDNCLAASGAVYDGPTRFNRYGTSQVFNYVTVLSESVKLMTESDMVVTIAHELGHYYLGHPLYLNTPDPAVPYNYLYIKTDRPDAGKPVPLPSNDPNYALVKEFDETIDFHYPVFEGQKYPTVLDLALAQSVSDGLNSGRIADRCITDTELKSCLAWGYEVTKPGQALVNWAFNSKADLFNPEKVAAGAAFALQFEEALAKHSAILRASDLITLQKELAKSLGAAAPPVELGTDKDLTIASFLPAYVEKAKIAIEANPKNVSRLTALISSKGLGFYTMEQEADDVATEILIELGFDPDLVVQNWLHFLDRSAQPQKEACKANYASGFKTPVWIGLSTEPHHGDCYRAYNAFQEMKNHQAFFEKHKVVKKIEAPGGSWEDVVATMKGKSFIAIPVK